MCLGSLSFTPGVTVYNEVVRAAAGISQPLHVLFKHFKQYTSTVRQQFITRPRFVGQQREFLSAWLSRCWETREAHILGKGKNYSIV